MQPDEEMLAYYQRGSELGRLAIGGLERLGLLRTKELIGRRLPKAPIDVLDSAPGQFTSSYSRRPEDLRAEALAAGFHLDDLVGIEGPGGHMADSTPAWSDPEHRHGVIALARALERAPSLLGYGPHLLALATKPTRPA